MSDPNDTINKTVAAFEAAVREHELLGSQEPEYHATIQRDYEVAKVTLLRLLAQGARDTELLQAWVMGMEEEP